MRKKFLLIHRWLSIPLGLFFSVLCFTGALLLFRQEIASLFGMDAREMPFFRGVMRLHRWLFLAPANPHGGMSVGRFIMGATSIGATFILLTGIVLWLPRSWRGLKPRLTVSVRRGWKRFVYDSHASLGIYVVAFLLLMSLTGPVWSFRWYRSAATVVVGTKDQPVSSHGRDEGRTASFSHGKPAAKSYQEKRDGSQPSAQRTFISLHTGKWGGTISRVIYLLAALIGGFLPLSGYYLWWTRRKRTA